MKICPYCKKEMKIINNTHLKTHGKTRFDYLKEFYPEQYYLEYIADFFGKYYKPFNNKFIEMKYSKYTQAYRWATINTSNDYRKDNKNKEDIKFEETKKEYKRWPLNKKDFMEHLQTKRTLGIIPHSHQVYFLTFDIDVYNFRIVLSITRAMNELGINNNQILTSFSGNKGYHVTIFFEDAIGKKNAQSLFNIILYKSGWYEDNYRTTDKGKSIPIIEHRGITQQGVKLPLSINLNNKGPLDNFCYLCDEYVNEVDTLTKIASMQKIPMKTLDNIINSNLKTVNKYIKELEEKRKKSINKNKKSSKQILKIVNREINNDELIITPGNRHIMIRDLAIENKVKRHYTQEENEEFLKNFSNNPKHCFNTSKEENEREIDSILNTIYNSKTSYKYENITYNEKIKFTKDEVMDILSLDKKLRSVYFAFIICYKRYGKSEEPEFYMAYSEIAKIAGGKNGDNRKKIEMLEELNKIKIIQKGEWAVGWENNKRKLTNKYALVNDIELDYTKCEFTLKTNKAYDEEITYKNFKCMCSKIFTIEELKNYFGSSKEVIRYKYSKLLDVA